MSKQTYQSYVWLKFKAHSVDAITGKNQLGWI